MSDIDISIINSGDINLTVEDSGTIDVSIIDSGDINITLDGISTFLALTDSPSSYSGQANKFVKVNSGEDAMEFVTSSASIAWGDITGTLSNQSDLQTELDAKVATTGNETIAGIKTFSSSPVVPTPTTDFQASTKKYVDDNSSEGTWGSITGTLSDQTDLQTELDAKEEDLTFSTGLTRTVNTITTNDSAIVHQSLSGAGTNTHAQIDTHIANVTTNPHVVTKTTVDLGNVDNTSDANKPVSTATQTALDLKIDNSEKAANNGVATLDGGGKIPATQLPSSVMEYLGTWNASTNGPTLVDPIGDNGDVYLVSVAGTQDLGSGSITFAVGDWIVHNGTIWEKSLNSDAVVSVNSQTGVVVLDADDVSDSSTTNKYTNATDITKLSNISVTQAVDLDTIESDTATNNAKVTNATHTGEVTGATTLTVDKTSISNKTTVTADNADFVLIGDTSDTGNLKKVLVRDFGSERLGDNSMIRTNSDTLTETLTIPSGTNGSTVGPVTITGSVTVNGSWTVI